MIKRLTVAFLLVGLGYLGFYVYGLVMGVFSPFQLVGFTILAVVFATAAIVHFLRTSRALRDDDGFRHSEMKRQHDLHERRGF